LQSLFTSPNSRHNYTRCDIIYNESNNFSLIGGYAVDAYSSLPRYSVDCDLVIAKDSFHKFDDLLKQNEYLGKRIGEEYLNHEVWQFQKFNAEKRVTVDLLIDNVKCRQTEAIWTYDEIRETSSEKRVVATTSPVQSIVASREQLIAMKLHSGRGPDLFDVVMLMDSVNWEVVLPLADRGDSGKVLSQLILDLEKISAETFMNELKTAYGAKAGKRDRKIKEATRGIKTLLGSMKERAR